MTGTRIRIRVRSRPNTRRWRVECPECGLGGFYLCGGKSLLDALPEAARWGAEMREQHMGKDGRCLIMKVIHRGREVK